MLLGESNFIGFLKGLDFFRLYSNMLGIVLWVYFAVITAQSVWGWYVMLAGKDKYTALLRRYLLVQGLRLRLRRFWGDIVICLLLCVAFFLIWRAEWIMYQIEDTLTASRK